MDGRDTKLWYFSDRIEAVDLGDMGGLTMGAGGQT